MNNNQKKKLAAEKHNKARAEQKAKKEAYELDKLENPEKYKRRNKKVMQGIMPFIALSAAAGFKI